jgi:hypothetical protein
MGRLRITAISSTESLLSVSSADARTHIFALSSGKLHERFAITIYIVTQFGAAVSQNHSEFLWVEQTTKALIVWFSCGWLNHPCDSSRFHSSESHCDKSIEEFIVVHGCTGEYVQGKPHTIDSQFSISTEYSFHISGVSQRIGFLSLRREVSISSSFHRREAKSLLLRCSVLDIGSPIYPVFLWTLPAWVSARKSNVWLTAVTTDGKMHIVPFLLHSIEKYYA